MSNTIDQKLGFDVSQVLEACRQVDAAFSGLQSKFTAVAGTMNSAGSQTTATANKIGAAFKTDITSGAASAQASTERLTTSLGLLSRVVFTQQIVSGLRIIKEGFAEALRSETDFQTKIAEIRTISPQESVNSLAESLRALSDEYNLPLIDVARSKYVLLSSGFTSTADSVNVLNAAFKLSKTGIADANQSVSLLSGALNAFGANSEQAETFAAKFFDAIKLGHLTAADLASNLDKVAPAAAALKVPLDELLAQFTSLSLAGVKTNQAATEINSVLSALIKQSPDAAEAIKKLGHGTDIREIIKDFGGVVPLVKALVDQAKGNPEVLAKIFPNVRSLREIFTLTNDGFERYQEHLKDISNFTVEDHVSVYAERVSGAAERVSNDANKIHNALDKAFGETIISAAHNLSEMVGGVDTLTAAISGSGPLLLGLGATLTALTVKLTAARLGATGFASALGALALVPVAQGLGATVGGFLDDKLAERTSAGLKKLEADNKASLDAFKANQAEKAKAAADSDQQRVASATAAAKRIEQLTGKPFTEGGFKGSADLGNTLSQAAKKAAELRAQQTTQDVALQQTANARSEIGQILSDSASRSGARQFPGSDQLRGNLDTFVAKFKSVSEQAKISDDDIAKLLKDLGELNTQTQGSGINARIAFGPEVANFAKGLDLLKQLQTQTDALKVDFNLAPQLQAIEQAIGQTTSDTEQAASAAATLAANYQQAAAAAQQAAAAAQQAAAAAGAGGGGGGGESENEAFGGQISGHYSTGGRVANRIGSYFATGGQARGTDTVPAMLTPGEFVMNAASTRKFYSQLVAMNADKPIYRAEGGPVNAHYGDVNLSVNASPNPQQTAREVMNLIRRETRRGSSLI